MSGKPVSQQASFLGLYKPEGLQAFQSQPINPTRVMVSASFSEGGSDRA